MPFLRNEFSKIFEDSWRLLHFETNCPIHRLLAIQCSIIENQFNLKITKTKKDSRIPSDSVGVKDRRPVVACESLVFLIMPKNMPALAKNQNFKFSYSSKKKVFQRIRIWVNSEYLKFYYNMDNQILKKIFRVSILLFQL